MKKIIFLLFIIFGTFSANAQEKKSVEPTPKTIVYGRIDQIAEISK